MKAPRTTIQRKLVIAIMLTSTTALVLTGAVLVAREAMSLRSLLGTELSTRAGILAANSTAALAFQNPEDARQVLSALRTDPSVVAAALYDGQGRLFATYPNGAAPPLVPRKPGRPGRLFEKENLVVNQSVAEGANRLGTLYIKTDLRQLDQGVRVHALVVLGALLGSIGVSFALSTWLQRRIAQPVLVLAKAARAVSERKDYSIRVETVSDDELGLLAGAFNDMLAEIQERDTALRSSEGRLRQLNAELEQRVAARTIELETSNKELEAFSYSVSHDLRAPLRAIDGFSKALLEDCGEALGETGTRHLERVRNATRQMGLLIDDLLNLARLSRAELRREPVDLGAVGQEIAASLEQAQPERKVSFVLAPDLRADGDSQLLRVVLDNLLRNAWKFTSKHPTGRIELGQTGTNGRRVFFVADDGAGFDMAHADLLFAPFQRLHRQSDFEGTGVGLATVQRIIHRHGGRLWAEGAVDKGATFYFTLWENGS
ncbi:MAG TPA: ATP-binding protein [Candidatus Limnocylindrales bacterium]|nr:ATP-binding protein [Candidatus Limnocylindrales bacterium]